jgi:hypothetical protein
MESEDAANDPPQLASLAPLDYHTPTQEPTGSPASFKFGLAGIALWVLLPSRYLLFRHAFFIFTTRSLRPLAYLIQILFSFGPALIVCGLVAYPVSRLLRRSPRDRTLWVLILTIIFTILLECISFILRAHNLATIAYVLAIPVTGIAGLVYGIREWRTRRPRRGQTIAGICMSLINLTVCGLIVGLIIYVISSLSGIH